MQWLAARGHGRIALLARHDAKLVKVQVYLPRDGGGTARVRAADGPSGELSLQVDESSGITRPGPAAGPPPTTLAELVAQLGAASAEVAAISAGGIGLERGGAALLVVIRADGTIAPPTPLALPDRGDGFATPPPVRMWPDGRRDGPAPIDVVFLPGPTAGSCVAAIEEAIHATPREMTKDLSRALGSTGFVQNLLVYAFGKASVGAVLPYLAELQANLGQLPVTYGGVPSDMNAGPQIEAELARCVASMPAGGEVLIAAHPSAPSSSIGQVLQEFGKRRQSRLALLARRGEKWVKFSVYLRAIDETSLASEHRDLVIGDSLDTALPARLYGDPPADDDDGR